MFTWNSKWDQKCPMNQRSWFWPAVRTQKLSYRPIHKAEAQNSEVHCVTPEPLTGPMSDVSERHQNTAHRCHSSSLISCDLWQKYYSSHQLPLLGHPPGSWDLSEDLRVIPIDMISRASWDIWFTTQVQEKAEWEKKNLSWEGNVFASGYFTQWHCWSHLVLRKCLETSRCTPAHHADSLGIARYRARHNHSINISYILTIIIINTPLPSVLCNYTKYTLSEFLYL